MNVIKELFLYLVLAIFMAPTAGLSSQTQGAKAKLRQKIEAKKKAKRSATKRPIYKSKSSKASKASKRFLKSKRKAKRPTKTLTQAKYFQRTRPAKSAHISALNIEMGRKASAKLSQARKNKKQVSKRRRRTRGQKRLQTSRSYRVAYATAPNKSVERATLQEQLPELQTKTWSGNVSMGISKNQDEYSDYFSALGLSISKQLSEKSSLSASTSYKKPIDNDYDEAKRYGVSDVELSLSRNELYRLTDNGSLSGNIGLTLPTSRTSQKASLRGAISAGLGTQWTFTQSFSVSTSHSVTVYNYEYETANVHGTSYNSPYGVSNGLNLAYSRGRAALKLGGSYYYSKNYANTEIQSVGLTGSVSYKWLENLSTSLGVSWRDRLITNNEMFDDDTTATMFTMNYNF